MDYLKALNNIKEKLFSKLPNLFLNFFYKSFYF